MLNMQSSTVTRSFMRKSRLSTPTVVKILLFICFLQTTYILLHTFSNFKDDINDDGPDADSRYTTENLPNNTTFSSDLSEHQMNADNTTSSPTASYKPKLILHVGPMKTGTTSIQLGVLTNRHFEKSLVDFDNYQLLNNLNYRAFKGLAECLIQHKENGGDECKENKDWTRIQDEYSKAYDKAMERHRSINNGTRKDIAEIVTLHSCETFSIIDRSKYLLDLFNLLYKKWDVHVIIYYRPVLDWLPSMYAQHRKHQLLHRYKFIQHYQGIDNEDTIGQYWKKWKESIKKSHTYSVHQFYHVLVHKKLGLPTNSSFGDGKPRMQILNMYSILGPGKEFLRNLPRVNHTWQYLINNEIEKGFTFEKKNEAMADTSMHDLIITEAWRQNLTSIGRHNATIHLETSMKKANLTVSDIPQSCLSNEERNDIWKWHLKSHSRYGGKSALTAEEMNVVRRDFDKKRSKLCSVNATAALEAESLRRLFDDCGFHSKFLLTSSLKPTIKEDSKWAEMNCTA